MSSAPRTAKLSVDHCKNLQRSLAKSEAEGAVAATAGHWSGQLEARGSCWQAAEGLRWPGTPNRRRRRLAVAGEDGAHSGAQKVIQSTKKETKMLESSASKLGI